MAISGGERGSHSPLSCPYVATDLPLPSPGLHSAAPSASAALIGRLARDERVRGRGMGELLLADAIHRILAAGHSIAVFAIVVDAKDEPAANFYKAFGFQAFPLRPRRLFLLTATAARGLERL